jgi:hypothetical protein
MPVGAYSQDLLTRIYNVHWDEVGGGLAVEFGDKAGAPPGPPPEPPSARRPQLKKLG